MIWFALGLSSMKTEIDNCSFLSAVVLVSLFCLSTGVVCTPIRNILSFRVLTFLSAKPTKKAVSFASICMIEKGAYLDCLLEPNVCKTNFTFIKNPTYKIIKA